MPDQPPRVRIAFARSELPEGARKVLVVGRREIIVLHDRGVLRALYNRCPHRQAPFTVGPARPTRATSNVGDLDYDAERRVLVCPWHRYEFDLVTGRCVADPARLRVATYRVAREGDEIAVYV